nr:helix-turn-helix domain-containing protein [Aliivibrio fischeri]
MVGEPFVNKIKEITGANTLFDLAEIFDIPKSTFNAWSVAKRSSPELIVRLHLAKGIPVEELAFEDGVKPQTFAEWISSVSGGNSPTKTDNMEQLSVSEVTHSYKSNIEKLPNPQHQTVIVQSFCLNNGKLLDTGEIPYALRMMNSWDLAPKNVIEVETNEGRYLVDTSQNDAVSGTYLIDTDGRITINTIQRLPNKLLVDFNGSTIELSDNDIKVMGRIAVTTVKN